MNSPLNTFAGDTAVLDFLNPENTPYTPLVEIPAALNPYRGKGVRIFAKLMNALPLANVKSIPAYNMLLEKRVNGGLEGIDTVIENSSGNTVFSLAVIARLMGIPHTKAVVSHEVTQGKLNLLRFLGTEIIVNKEPICPDPSDPTSGIYKSKVWAKENNWFNPGQYDNEANPAAHYKWTGPQIWEQTAGNVSLLSVGLGTTGSIVGLGKFLKEKNKNIEIIGVSRIQNNPVPGVRTSNLLKEIAFDWKSNMDYHEEVGTVESFRKSMELCRAGLLVGPSSGFALIGMLNHLSKQDLSSESGQEKIAVFICPDSPFPYIDEYFEFLEEQEFPEIENIELLNEGRSHVKRQNLNQTPMKELDPQQACALIFSEPIESVWDKIKSKQEVHTKKGYRIIDVRDSDDYQHYHIPNSENVPLHEIDTFLQNDTDLKDADGVIFVCYHGNASRLATHKALQAGIDAFSLNGGNVEWSRLGLPRIRPETCITRFDL